MREIRLLLSDIPGRNITRTRSCWTRSRKRSKLADRVGSAQNPIVRRTALQRGFYVDPAYSNFRTRAATLGSGSTRQPTIRRTFPQPASEDGTPQGSGGLASRASRWDRSEALAFLSLGARPVASFSGNLRQPPASPTPRRLHWLSERGISTVVSRSTNA